MKIAVLHSSYSERQPSGENSVVSEQVRALRSAGHEVALVNRSTDDASGHRLYSARSAFTVATGLGSSPARHLDVESPDIVHVHNTFPNWGVRALRRDWQTRMVLTLHNYRTVCARATLHRDGGACHQCLRVPVLPAVIHRCYRDSGLASAPVGVAAAPFGPLRRLAESAARVTVLNRDAKDFFEGVLDREVVEIPNFTATPSSIDHSSGRQGWAYVGRLTEEKGLRWLFANWPVGETLDVYGDGPLMSSLRMLQERRKDDIRLHGNVERARILELLRSYKGLVVPSLWAEGLPTVLLEALSVGTPSAMSTAVSVGRDFETRGVTGLFDVRDGSSGLEHALRFVDSAGSAMRRTCIEVHAAEYSEQAWVRRMTSLYEGLLRDA
jgi:glycosyltransferase involved in cell wall biosynthesis